MNDAMSVANSKVVLHSELKLNKLHDVIVFKRLKDGMLISHNEILTYLSNEDVAKLKEWIDETV